MAITGKKFSQLTQEQQIATRVPITGWIVNNVFINPINVESRFLKENVTVGLSENGEIILVISDNVAITVAPAEAEIGTVSYIVNYLTKDCGITGDAGVTILPYATCKLSGMLGVFKVEKTGASEWTVSVEEKGIIEEVILGGES